MKGLRSTISTLLFLFLLGGVNYSNAQCTTSCTNSDPLCPNFSCCKIEPNHKNFGNKTPIATNAEVGDYNCHQYVKDYLYGGHSGQAILDCDNQSTCPCYVYKNGSFTAGKEFVQVQWESQASAIYYPCDHSAVKIGYYQYVSKDGHGGDLYAHGPTEYAANSNLCYPYTRWAYLGEIEKNFSGNSLSGPGQLWLKNNSGVNYEWCANPSNLVSITGGNTSSATITPTGTGTVEIRVKTTGYNNSVKTQCITLNVSGGSQECGNLNIVGTVTTSGYTTSLNSYNSIFSTVSYVNVSGTFAHHFEWIKNSGNASYSTNSNGSNVTLYMQSSQYLDFTVNAFNSSNVCLGSRDVFFTCTTTGGGWWYMSAQENPIQDQLETSQDKVKSESFINEREEGTNLVFNDISIFPNPTSNYFTVELKAGILRDISIFNAKGELVLHPVPENSSNKQMIDISLLTEGIYFVQVSSNHGNKFMRKILKL